MEGNSKYTYEITGDLPDGEVYELHTGTCQDGDRTKQVLIRISLGPDVNDLAENEARILDHLNLKIADLKKGNRLMIPELVESFEYRSRRVVVTDYADGYFTLEEVHQNYPDGIPTEAMAWMFNRMLAAMMVAHTSGIIHGAILPSHVLVFSGTLQDSLCHTAVLVDWTNSVEETSVNVWSKLSSMSSDEAYQCFYPPEVLLRKPATPQTDLAMAAGCAIYLLGGDVETGTVPESTPWNIAQLLRTCREPNPAQRPRDIAAFHQQFKQALKTCFGKPQFHVLPLRKKAS